MARIGNTNRKTAKIKELRTFYVKIKMSKELLYCGEGKGERPEGNTSCT